MARYASTRADDPDRGRDGCRAGRSLQRATGRAGFVLEEAQRDFRPIVFGAAFLAAAITDIVTRLASGQLPVFSVPNYPAPPLAALPVFAILGLAPGVLGVVFNRSLLWTLDLFALLRGRRRVLVVAVVGVVG